MSRINKKGEEICDCHRGTYITATGKCAACNLLDAEERNAKDEILKLQDKAFYLVPKTEFEEKVREILIALTFRLQSH